MHRSLIVARVVPDAEEQVAGIFAASDRHGSESGEEARRHPEFVRISERLAPYVSPYPPTWQSPREALARCFHHRDAPTVAGRIR